MFLSQVTEYLHFISCHLCESGRQNKNLELFEMQHLQRLFSKKEKQKDKESQALCLDVFFWLFFVVAFRPSTPTTSTTSRTA